MSIASQTHSTATPSQSFSFFASRLMLGVFAVGILLGLTPRLAVAQTSTYVPQVQQMYIAYFGRPGDPAGVDYWVGRLADAGGAWTSDLINAFGNSAEYTERFAGVADAALINNLFLGMFNRTADLDGLAYYVDLLNGSDLSGNNSALRQSTLATIALDIANGAQKDDQAALRNKLEIAHYFTTAIRTNQAIYGENEIGTTVVLLADVDSSADSLEIARANIDAFVGEQLLGFPINDTGIDWCAYGNVNFLVCPVAGYIGQDGESGRDALVRRGQLEKFGGGRAGFDFTKIDLAGNDLPANAFDWSCVRDNVTGAIWEVKTDDGGLRDKEWTYSWYDANAVDGDPGFEDRGICQINGRCDMEKYVEDVNAQGLCGFNDWRLPTPSELSGIIDHGIVSMPAIDLDYFRNVQSSGFWSLSPYADYPPYAWRVDFDDGGVSNDFKERDWHVLLVRAEASTSAFVDHGDGTITDVNTGLMWAKCSAGLAGSDCSVGDVAAMDWQNALAYAEDVIIGNYSDWRLPTVKELQSLVDYSTHSPATVEQYFPATPSFGFWSSSPNASHSNHAWQVYFGDGFVHDNAKVSESHVRLVRAGQ